MQFTTPFHQTVSHRVLIVDFVMVVPTPLSIGSASLFVNLWAYIAFPAEKCFWGVDHIEGIQWTLVTVLVNNLLSSPGVERKIR